MPKRITLLLLAFFIFVLALAIFIKPFIIILAKQQLKNIFKESTVSISGCEFRPLSRLSLAGIEIKRDNIYNLKIKEARISYSPASLVRRDFLKFYLTEVQISVDLPGKNIAQLSGYLNLKSQSAFFLKSIEISNANLNLNSKDVQLEASASIELDLAAQLINSCDIKIASLVSQGFKLENAYLKVSQIPSDGEFYLEQAQYDKARITEIRSKVRLEGKNLFLDNLSAVFCGGKIQAQINLKLEKSAQYFADLKFINFDLQRFADDFNLNEKVQLSGRINGEVTLKGIGRKVNILSGQFLADKPGGTLTVKDDKVLKNMAAGSGQSLDLLVESLKDYRYNTGTAALSLKEGNLVLDAALDGEAGKRNLNIILHNF